jgi:NADPH:quinone reductase-like Zn-dependent oxidoreductase
MKAVVCHRYGSPDVLKLEEIDKPVVPDDGVLVRVQASSVNPADFYSLTRTAYIARMLTGLLKPKREVLGRDFAGTVEAVGKSVTQFQPGDEVFGGRRGAFAEYVCVPEKGAVVRKPVNVTFEQAAAVPVAAITALQALRDHGHVQPGQKVLINGASGGVGTFAVQIAKSFAADVTGVCSTRNVDIVRSIGADSVIDYTREDFTRSGLRYDLMLDIAGNRSWSVCRRVLDSKATFVAVGGSANTVFGAGRTIRHVASVRLASLRGSQKVVLFVAKLNKEDLVVLQELLEAGRVTPVIDRRYELSEVPASLRYMGEGHAKGKIVITV